jgi:hypothetical protein
MDRNADDLNDPMREQRLRDQRMDERGLDRSGAPDSTATSDSLVGDSMRAGAPRGDALDVDRDANDLRRDDVNPGDEIGEAVGGISGVLTGAALGSLGGPIGTIIGGIAGAVSGWWAGRAISEAASHATNDDDEYYRTHFDGARGTATNRSYDDVRPAYQLGHMAGRNPDYQTRSFDEVERDLRHGWTADVSEQHGQWDDVRDYARHAYERGRTGGADSSAMGVGLSNPSDQRIARDASALGTSDDSAIRTGGMGAMGGAMAGAGGALGNQLDDLKDRVDGNPASRPGLDATDSMHRANPGSGVGDRAEHAADRAGNALGNAWDKTKDAAHRAADKVGDALDDTKDRVDGNPSSRPGVDRTDDPDRRY